MQFKAYVLAKFTEYTAWAAFGEYANEVLNMCIDNNRTHKQYLSVRQTTLIPSFVTVAYIELWMHMTLFLLANHNKYANEVLHMRIFYQQQNM